MIEAIRKALNDYIQENNEKCELCSKVIHNYFHTWKISQPFLCSPEIILYVAACAIKEEKPEIVKELLRIYEEVFPNADELSAISYLIRAEMILKFTTADMNSLDIVIKSIYKCINISNRVKNENILASACAMLYRSIRLYLRPMTRPYMIKYLKPIVKMLSESDMKAYKWQILFIRVLLEAYIQTGQRKEASHLVDMASNGPARHLPQQMVQLLVRASASNLASADRHISWAMGASVAPETDQTAPVEKPATYVDSHKRNNYPQMSGQLAQTLIQSGLVPANRIAKLRVVTKEGGEQVDEIVRLLRLLSPPEESTDGRNARSEQLALSPTDPKKKTDISGEGAVPGDDEWTERIKFFPDDTFSLLFQLGLVAVARKLPAVTEACVCSCKRILTQEKLTDPASAEVCTELLRLELFALEEDFRCGSDAVDLIQVHLQLAKRCQQLVELAVRRKANNETVQASCVTLWNICLPLFQKSIRQDQLVRHCLQLIVDTLDQCQRCQAHLMLSHCLADVEKLAQALIHLEKVFVFDDMNEFTEGAIHMYNRLQLRSTVYEIPDRVEDCAAQIIEHLRSVTVEDFSARKLAELFQTAIRSEQFAGQGFLPASGRSQMTMRDLLSRVGELLAPKCFLIALDRETMLTEGLREQSFGTMDSRFYTVEMVRRLANRTQQWIQCADIVESAEIVRVVETSKLEGTFKERLLLWADLARVARRFNLWDVCTLACRFGLRYDTDAIWSEIWSKFERGKAPPAKSGVDQITSQKKVTGNVKDVTSASTNEAGRAKIAKVVLDIRTSKTEQIPPKRIVQILRESYTQSTQLSTPTHHEYRSLQALTELYCLYAESLSMVLRNQPCGAKLGRCHKKIKLPLLEDNQTQDDALDRSQDSLRERRYFQRMKEESRRSQMWIDYCEWLDQVSSASLEAFQRSLLYACRLRDTNLLKTGTICVWTHCLPVICSGNHTLLVPTFQIIVDCANKFGSTGLPVEIYTEVATVLAHGLIQPHLPRYEILDLYTAQSQKRAFDAEKSNDRKTTKSPKTNAKSVKPTVFAVAPEAQLVLKQANDVLTSAAKLVEQAECVTDLNTTGSAEFIVQRPLPELISLKTRSRLVLLWLTVRQLMSTTPTYKTIVPTEDRSIDPSVWRTSQLHYRGPAFTRALMAVSAIWLSNENTILTEWPTIIAKLTGSDRTKPTVKSQILPMPPFRDAPSLQEAVEIMKQAFFYESDLMRTNLMDNECELNNSADPSGRELYHLHLPQTERCVELELWTRLALYAIHTEQYSVVLDITHLIDLPNQPDPQSSALNYWAARLYDLRGLAVLGLAEQLRLQKFGTEPTLGKNRKAKVIDVQIRPVCTLEKRSMLLSQAGETVEASLFAAGEEAFYKAAEFAVKIKRYDMVLGAFRHYWTVCNQPAIAITPDVKTLIKDYATVRVHLTNLNEGLTQSLDPSHRAQLNEEIRSQTKTNSTPAVGDSAELGKAQFSSQSAGVSAAVVLEEEESIGSLFATHRVAPPTLKQFEEDLRLRSQIYTVLFQVFEMEGKIDIGLKLLTDALQRFPRTQHRLPLFRLLVRTKAMLGKPYHLDMQKFSHQSENRQAELWRELAYTSIQPADQFNAFRQAVDVLKNPRYMGLKAELYLEFAQWLYNHRLEATTCVEMVEQAIDLLISHIQYGTDESVGKSTGKAIQVKQKDNKLATKHQTVTAPKLGRTQDALDRLDSCESVNRLDALVRSFVLLAEMLHNSGQTDGSGNGWSDYLKLAVVCVQQIWQLLLVLLRNRIDKIRKLIQSKNQCESQIKLRAIATILLVSKSTTPKAMRGKPSADAGKTKTNRTSSNKSRANSPDKVKSKPKSSKMPQTIQEWSLFELPDELLTKFWTTYEQYEQDQGRTSMEPSMTKRDNSAKSKTSSFVTQPSEKWRDTIMRQINPLTFTRPHVTVSALTQLSTYLTDTGYSQLAFPVLLLQECLTRPSAAPRQGLQSASTTANVVVRLKLMELCCFLNLENGIIHHQNLLGRLAPNDDEVARALIDQTSQSGKKVCSRLAENWLELSERLIQLSQGASARQFLELAERFGEGVAHQRRLLFSKAKLALVEGQCGSARQLIAEVMKQDGLDEELWLRSVLLRADSLCNDPQLVARSLPTKNDSNPDISDEPTPTPFFPQAARCHYGLYTARNELEQAEKELENWFTYWPNRRGWYRMARGLILSRRGQLESKLVEATYQLTFLTSPERHQHADQIWLQSSAPRLLEEAGKLLAECGHSRNALRLGWFPLATYWSRLFTIQIRTYLERLREKLVHPLQCLRSFTACLHSVQTCHTMAAREAQNVKSMSDNQELSGVSIPVERDLFEAEFMLVEFLSRVMQANVAYERIKGELDRQKDPLARAVNIYASHEPEASNTELTDTERTWNEKTSTAFDTVTSLLANMFVSSERLPLIRARCLVQLGRILRLQSEHLIPDIPSLWDEVPRKDNEDREIVDDTAEYIPTRSSEKMPLSVEDLHLGYRWRTKEDVFADLRLHQFAVDLQALSTTVLLSAFKLATQNQWVGLSRSIMEELLVCVGGSHEAFLNSTQGLLNGFQSYTTCCRLRTHLASTVLLYSTDSDITDSSLSCHKVTSNNNRSALSRGEALLRQFLWLMPCSLCGDSTSLAALFGLVSNEEPGSYAEQMTWSVGLKSVLSGGFFSTPGGLDHGTADHSVTASPWITKCQSLLFIQCSPWNLTDVKSSIILEPGNSLTSILTALPGSNSSYARSWNVLLMEHSSDYQFLYVSLPICQEKKLFSGTGSVRRVSTTKSVGKKSGQFAYLRIATNRMNLIQSVLSWKSFLSRVDKSLRQKRNMISGAFDEPNVKTYGPLMDVINQMVVQWVQTLAIRRSSSTDSNKISLKPSHSSITAVLKQLLDSNRSTNGLLMLTDMWLAELPLEAFLMQPIVVRLVEQNALHRASVASPSNPGSAKDAKQQTRNSRSRSAIRTCQLPFTWISRDFSLQWVCSRLTGHQHLNKNDSGETSVDPTVKPSARKSEQHGIGPRHPLLRDQVSKHGVTGQSRSNVSVGLTINSSAVRYIVDLYGDSITLLEESEREKRISTLGSTLSTSNSQDPSGHLMSLIFADHMTAICNNPSTRSQTYTNRWIGMTGQVLDGYVPSTEEIYSILNENTEGFFAYMPESLLSQIPPNIIANLSLTGCRLACLFDRVHTPGSLLRQGKLEVTKTILEHELEQPTATVVLLSLVGCQSILTPSWTTNVTELQYSIEGLLKAMLDENRPVGESTSVLQLKHMLMNHAALSETIKQDEPEQSTESRLSSEYISPALDWTAFNMVLYGLPNISF